MAITFWPGVPAPRSLICAAPGAAWLFTSLAKSLVAAAFNGYEPAVAAAVKTYRVAGAAAAGAVLPVLGVVVPPAVLFAPVLVRWTTSRTITTTPTTDESRYRTIRIPPSRCGGRWADRDEPDRGGLPEEAKSSLPKGGPPGCW